MVDSASPNHPVGDVRLPYQVPCKVQWHQLRLRVEVPGDCLRGWPAGKMIRRKKVASGGGQVVAKKLQSFGWSLELAIRARREHTETWARAGHRIPRGTCDKTNRGSKIENQRVRTLVESAFPRPL
ncbi:hypothetical protein C8J57DRAFT_1251020 [Mycena rebaudengoi]|nr:hypothetical protein C8J57DRAFT_1251020 [Mycena rebaudengoi]